MISESGTELASRTSSDCVGPILAHAADVNARSAVAARQPIFSAERNTSPKTLALLNEHGADLTVRDADGQTPLEIARLNGKSRLI